MIYLTGDSTAGYYVGLLLCLMGTSFVSIGPSERSD